MIRLRPVLLLLAAAALLPAAGTSAEEGLPEFIAPLRLDVFARRGLVEFRHSEPAEGSPGEAFDGKTATAFRLRGGNPGFLEVTFREPREIRGAQAFFPGDVPHEWSLLAGDDGSRMAVVFQRRRVDPGAWSRVEPFRPPLRARVIRIVALRLDGGKDLSFGEIALETVQAPERIDLESPGAVATPEGMLPVRARITWDGGAVSTLSHGLRFETPRGGNAVIESSGPWGEGIAMVRFSRPGPARVRAFLPGRRGARLHSEWMDVSCEEGGKPDWCVGWIERTPRIPWDAPGGGWPAAESSVLWTAHVRNYGTADAPGVKLRWYVDGSPVAEGALEGIRRYEAGTAVLRRPWDGRRHEVRCTIDPGELVEELEEGNNTRAVATDALLLGLWIEAPLPFLFARTQPAFGDGSVGFEDWAQRQVDRWNRLLAGARHPLTPDGIPDRVALDRVVIVEEGRLPLAGGLPDRDPDRGDRTVDLMWGFPASLAEGPWPVAGPAKVEGNPLWLDDALLGNLSRARYLADPRRLDVAAAEVLLPGPGGLPLGGSPLLPADAGGWVHRSPALDPARGYDPHAAFALARIAGRRARAGNRFPAPDEGEYLGDLPDDCALRVTDREGRPLEGVAVRAWRRAPGPDGREVFAGEPVRTGTTREDGHLSLAGADGRDPFFEGARGGALDAGRGVLLLEFRRGESTAWRFLEVVPYNLARWAGARTMHREEVAVDLP